MDKEWTEWAHGIDARVRALDKRIADLEKHEDVEEADIMRRLCDVEERLSALAAPKPAPEAPCDHKGESHIYARSNEPLRCARCDPEREPEKEERGASDTQVILSLIVDKANDTMQCYKQLDAKIDALKASVGSMRDSFDVVWQHIVTRKDLESLRDEHRKALYDVLAESRLTCPEGEEAERTALLDEIRKVVREEISKIPTPCPMPMPYPVPSSPAWPHPWPIITSDTTKSPPASGEEKA